MTFMPFANWMISAPLAGFAPWLRELIAEPQPIPDSSVFLSLLVTLHDRGKDVGKRGSLCARV
jgi:hypothetical protein